MSAYQTPHLTTAMTGPLYLLEQQLLEYKEAIEHWFKEEWRKTPAPMYGSVDLRNAGFKLAPVDMNLFPAGFNNLNPVFLPLSIQAAKIAFANISPKIKRILLIPENHTRNLFYWENIHALKKILIEAGFEVQIGSLLPLQSKIKVTEEITLQPLIRIENKIQLDDFIPDVILLNNDLSEGIPEILKNSEQLILPPPTLGWNRRLKSGHFQHYANVTAAFAELIKIDHWFISPLFRHCGEVNFLQHEGEDCLVRDTEQLLLEIQRKYEEYNIPYNPFIVIKADAGTYGMAVMTVRSIDEMLTLNRKQRTKMSISKGGLPVSKVIMQEGIYTFETWGKDNAAAEPVVYLWGQRVVGGFYRVHQERGIDENLNSPGMQFEPLAFEKTCHEPAHSAHPDECQNRFYAYGVIARLSMLAAAREISEAQS